jgi:hypothetical protein
MSARPWAKCRLTSVQLRRGERTATNVELAYHQTPALGQGAQQRSPIESTEYVGVRWWLGAVEGCAAAEASTSLGIAEHAQCPPIETGRPANWRSG